MPEDATKTPQPLQLEASFDLLDLHRLNPKRYPHLLQTASRPEHAPAYDILFAFPEATLRMDGDGTRFIHTPSIIPGLDVSGGFLDIFDRWWRAEQLKNTPDSGSVDDLPFSGGWFLYLGYELCTEIEPTLKTRMMHPVKLPTALATRFKTAIIYDHSRQAFYCAAEPGCQHLLEEIERDINSAAALKSASDSAFRIAGRMEEESPQQYLDGVERIKRYIREGDIFQANLSRSWWIDTDEPADTAGVYASLRKRNPAPFAGLASFDDFTLLSSSPERLLRIRGRIAETRPIAGTRPRSLNRAEDKAYSRELITHPKERAEHIMLIDLERNDLGRVCKPGSIHVSELMALESYAHVHHIVSNIRGELHQNVTPGRAISAVFPGGTITGCPKVRCMEILSELECRPRGPYTGSIGYVNLNGDMDFNILIRTIMADKTRISLQAGAGIVADSDPARELEETRAKAKGMLNALGINSEGMNNRGIRHG